MFFGSAASRRSPPAAAASEFCHGLLRSHINPAGQPAIGMPERGIMEFATATQGPLPQPSICPASQPGSQEPQAGRPGRPGRRTSFILSSSLSSDSYARYMSAAL